jgi:NAD-dependent DNA ligase
MSQQPDLELLPREDRIILAIQAIQSDASLSQRRAAVIYNVSESTLRTRRAKTTSRRDSHPNSSKLQRHEEETIVQYIRKLDARGFAPTLSYVREMANQLLATRGGGQVGEKWARNLVRRKPAIKS